MIVWFFYLPRRTRTTRKKLAVAGNQGYSAGPEGFMVRVDDDYAVVQGRLCCPLAWLASLVPPHFSVRPYSVFNVLFA